jgi:hypothetical protein
MGEADERGARERWRRKLVAQHARAGLESVPDAR